MELKQMEMFEKMPVPKAVIKNALPAMIGMLVVFFYNIADAFFVGQTGDELQVAAVTLTTPVFLMFMAVGVMIGVGGTSVIARAYGERREGYARQVSAFCFYASIAFGVLLMVIFWGFMPQMLSLIGTSEDTIGFARDYLVYVTIAAPFVVFSQAFTNIIRAEGQPNVAMIGMLIGTIVNIILDPIMILWMGMGIQGAAIATVIGNVAGTAYFLVYFFRGRSKLSIAWSDFKFEKAMILAVFAIGIPAALNNLLMSLANVILNNFLVNYGDTAVAAMGVALRASMIVAVLQIGLAQGIQPLMGFAYGANNLKRFKALLRFSLLFSVVLGGLLTFVYYIGTKPIIAAFINNTEVISFGVQILRALLLTGPILGVMFVFTFTLQAMGKSRPSLILSLARQGLVFIPLLFLLDALFGLDGIVYAQPAADAASVALSAVLMLVVYRNWQKTLPAAEEIFTNNLASENDI